MSANDGQYAPGAAARTSVAGGPGRAIALVASFAADVTAETG
jgi:hypothetical protein